MGVEPEVYAVILAFGDTIGPDGSKVPASALYAQLELARAWFLPRSHGSLRRTHRYLFYQNRTGVRGEAMLASFGRIGPEERPRLRGLGIEHFRVKLVFQSWRTFEEAIPLGPLVRVLDFVKNKTYWGHSLRGGPRAIGKADYLRIIDTLAVEQQ